ncbi:hypothetical protein F3Y22_tig00110287pilonHSYRG00037 [Hibiscus syriacus]|uniref:Uncharacterized protein n=1 Tax=Hibiscus syriacus TaxID=106335 RepID=A0A6A3B431_HIBSY|nr:hypothetical protein F3Y22_tig00110287pilonHSYRG00037 [Hibiscus syriacus]
MDLEGTGGGGSGIVLSGGKIPKDFNLQMIGFDHFVAFLLLKEPQISVELETRKTNGVCVSQGGHFPPFSSKGKPPNRVGKGHKDLTLCRLFRKKICCDAAQTHPPLLSIRRLALTGEASQECLHLWELLECSTCDPRVGIKPGPRLYAGLSAMEYFWPALMLTSQWMQRHRFSSKTVELAALRLWWMICWSGWLPSWSFPSFEVEHLLCQLCLAAGFGVEQSFDMHSGDEEASCYGGKASLDLIADSWGASRTEEPHESCNFGLLEDFEQWLQDMPSNERVSWAVGGQVLTAGLLFASKRKSHNHRQKLAAIQRAATARRLEGKMNQTAPSSSQGNRKENRR